ncbi:DUF4302 domain-containing protein [Flavobacterium sp. MR2016-29]|uniref:DUF4302 domain-containing protein n=1 Tax=Flavobacterium sp. MR2016-29 TaxID=2783795 RepID=UPI00188A8711|nr:DUF4302 domain-containing protein [Flavobacterium sp. MR2016-29]MBF4491078.1 DUF4302 domain-containing protein [Flavobacterium sp. MR2016-29]
MKPKNIFKYLMVAFFAIHLLGSCSSDTEAEQKFDKTPVERINEQKTELSTALLSSEFGWKAVYFTDDTQLGGFTHLFKFSADGKVQMASDFDADTATYESTYSIALGSTVSLLFDSYNRIHLLSDSNSYPTTALRGKGYLGDFQFLYYGQENGDLLFKSNRLVRDVRFVKATAQDWANLPKNLITEQNVIGGIERPLFRVLEINDGTVIKKYDFGFSPVTRFSSSKSIDVNSSEVISMGVGYTPTSIVVSPAVTVGGQSLKEFVYNDADGSFKATGTGGVTATIKYSNAPLVLNDDYKIVLPGKVYSRFGYYPDDFTADASTNSKLFQAEIDKINANLPAGQYLTSVQLYLNHSLGNFIYYTFVGRGALQHFVDVQEDAVGKKIILKHKSWNGNTTVSTPAFLAGFDKYLMDANGIYVKKESFKLYYSNTVYTFTSSSSPFRMTTWQLN